MSASKSKSSQSQSTTNTFTDESANAGGDNSLAIGAGTNVESIGGNKLTTGANAQISITDASPEALKAAFEFGTDALEALSQNTDRQVTGAVEAARLASEAAARAAANQGAAEAIASAKPNPFAALADLPKWVWAVAAVLVGGLAFLAFRNPSRSRR